MVRLMFTCIIYSIILSNIFGNELTSGIRTFTSKFYQKCAKSTTENIIVSPISVANALVLLSQAAHGKTFEEIRAEFNLNAEKSTAANQFHQYYESLKDDAGAAILSIANQIYVQHGYKLKKNFQEAAVQHFLSGIESLNFANKFEAASTINQFVEEKTNRKIKNLIKSDTLDADSRIVLVNAVYFKGDWKYKFNPEFTTKGAFYRNEVESITVDFMHIDEQFNYGNLVDLDATALEMKYFNSNFSMVFILPNKRAGLSDLEDKLSGYDMTKIQNAMHSHRIEVDIPKFKVEFETKLNDVLKNMGMVEMFTPNADLSGLLEVKEPLYVSDTVHKAIIEIDEKGSEAAATTSLVITKRIGGVAFHADHPFIYYIWDKNSQTTVFIGRLTNFN